MDRGLMPSLAAMAFWMNSLARVPFSVGQIPRLLSPVLDVGVVQPFLAQQSAPLGAALGQGVEGSQDPRLVGLGERPPLGPARLLIGHPTILPRHRGLVGEGHRHCLDSPVQKDSFVLCLTAV
jgi:hypothetical protein